MRAILLGLMLLMLIACEQPHTGVRDEEPLYHGAHGVVDRFVDDEAGVVCYLYYSQGIHCLPLTQTRLAR